MLVSKIMWKSWSIKLLIDSNLDKCPQKYATEMSDLEPLGELGHGTCGHVVKMRHKKTGAQMAVKVRVTWLNRTTIIMMHLFDIHNIAVFNNNNLHLSRFCLTLSWRLRPNHLDRSSSDADPVKKVLKF